MRKIVLLFCFIMSIGCSSTMTRYGYDLKSLAIKEGVQCVIPIKRNFSYKKEEVKILGSIKAGDSGFSVKCGEAYVLKQFQQEACALGADLVNIIDESRFDILSTCYRKRGRFYLIDS